MIDAKKYTISVQYGNFDGESCYAARVKEMPEIEEYADSYEEAYSLAIDSVEVICEHYESKGTPCPAPSKPTPDSSGRVTLRLPISLHQKLSQDADSEKVSLNQHIVNLVCYAQGAADTTRELDRRVSKIAANIGSAIISQYTTRKDPEIQIGISRPNAASPKYPMPIEERKLTRNYH